MRPEEYTTPSTTLLRVLQKMKQRELFGVKKYGTTVDRNDLTSLDWINHAQEEAMDLILYLERLKDTIGDKQT